MNQILTSKPKVRVVIIIAHRILSLVNTVFKLCNISLDTLNQVLSDCSIMFLQQHLCVIFSGNTVLLQGMVKVKVLVAQSCLILCNSMDCSPPGSSVHGILQARILEWVAVSFSRGSSPTQGSNPGLPHCRQILYHLSHQVSFNQKS